MCLLAAPCLAFCQGPQKTNPAALPAPTYYIAAQVRGTCERDEISVHGATNLPPGSMVTLTISNFDGDGWKDYSDENYAVVDAKGFFDAKIHPRRNIHFRHNLILLASFMPFRPRQPEKVLKVAGKRGQKLGDELSNPQVLKYSGENYILWTIARVPSC